MEGHSRRFGLRIQVSGLGRLGVQGIGLGFSAYGVQVFLWARLEPETGSPSRNRKDNIQKNQKPEPATSTLNLAEGTLKTPETQKPRPKTPAP